MIDMEGKTHYDLKKREYFMIRRIGRGYYGVDGKGVTISRKAWDKVSTAFDKARDVRDEDILIGMVDFAENARAQKQAQVGVRSKPQIKVG